MIKTAVTTITYRALSQSILGVLAFSVLASGQPTDHVYHPDDYLRVVITFEGPDAGRIHRAAFQVRMTGSAKGNQPAFETALFAQDSKPTTPNTFEVSVKIPKNQASGDYKLTLIRGFVVDPDLMFDYDNIAFKDKIYTIENRDRIVKPTIKDIK